MREIAIRTQQLTKDFGAIRAVDHIDLQVPAGTVFGFLGANGAGKTTTIHLLLALLDPTGGAAEVLGYDTRTQGQLIRQQSGALLEFNGLYERLTAEENLDFYGRIWHLPAAERVARIKELLTHLELYDRRTDRVDSWSRGMKQKLAVARVLMHRPKLIFLDEPTAGLDPIAAAALRDDLASLSQREGVTVFLTTHNLPEAERLCQQVGVIREGKLIAIGSPDSLRVRSGRFRTEISGSGFSADVMTQLRSLPDIVNVELQNGRLIVDTSRERSMAPIVTLLVQGGAQIEEVRRGAASLEEAFLALMEVQQ